jgi:hypothetical protein
MMLQQVNESEGEKAKSDAIYRFSQILAVFASVIRQSVVNGEGTSSICLLKRGSAGQQTADTVKAQDQRRRDGLRDSLFRFRFA